MINPRNLRHDRERRFKDVWDRVRSKCSKIILRACVVQLLHGKGSVFRCETRENMPHACSCCFNCMPKKFRVREKSHFQYVEDWSIEGAPVGTKFCAGMPVKAYNYCSAGKVSPRLVSVAEPTNTGKFIYTLAPVPARSVKAFSRCLLPRRTLLARLRRTRAPECTWYFCACSQQRSGLRILLR